jgi:hypothetical protein
MSRENAEVLRGLIEAWNCRDCEERKRKMKRKKKRR